LLLLSSAALLLFGVLTAAFAVYDLQIVTARYNPNSFSGKSFLVVGTVPRPNRRRTLRLPVLPCKTKLKKTIPAFFLLAASAY